MKWLRDYWQKKLIRVAELPFVPSVKWRSRNTRRKVIGEVYAAANNGFSDMEIGTRWNKYNWPEFFQVVAQPLRTDNRLRVIVAKQVVNGFLPRLAGKRNTCNTRYGNRYYLCA